MVKLKHLRGVFNVKEVTYEIRVRATGRGPHFKSKKPKPRVDKGVTVTGNPGCGLYVSILL